MKHQAALRSIIVIATALLAGTLPAVGQFGKNKVQYQEFDWHFIQSKHFDVYYHQGGKYLADFTAIIAEKALHELQRNVNYQITKRIPIIVYNSHNQFQQTNTTPTSLREGIAGFTEPLKNRIVVPFEGKWDFFRVLIRHELVHAFINDMFYGGSVQSQIANNIRLEYPLWMSEGFAEFSAIEGMDTKTDMFLRDLAISESLPPLSGLLGYTAYRGGQSFFWYVAEKYGRAKTGELINRIKSIGTVNGAFQSTFGMTLDEFSDQWRKDMKKIYWPDIVKYEDADEFATRITDHRKNRTYLNTAPALSPNGEKLAFISLRDGFYSVYMLELDNKKKVKRVVEGSRSRDFEELNILTPGISWDPDGRRLAISAKSGGDDALFIVDTENNEVERIDVGLHMVNSATWSPDGQYIALVASEREQPDLFLYELGSGDIRKLTDDIFQDQKPTWAPDSETLYFVSNRGDFLNENVTSATFRIWNHEMANSDIYALDVKTGAIERKTFDPQYIKTSIAVGPEGRNLLFVSDKSGIGNIYQLDLTTGDITAKTNALSGIEQLSLSRDGSKMLFSSQNNGSFDIFMLRFPFDLPDTEPVLTEFRRAGLAQANMLSEALEFDEDLVEDSGLDSLSSYGIFDVDFGRQKAVQPNPDAVAAIDDLEDNDLPEVEEEFIPQRYKINFTPDLIYGNAGFDTFFGVQGTTQMMFSDMLGNHQIFFAANLLLSLNNSDFLLVYSYLPNLVDYRFSGFHTARFVNRDDNTDDGESLYRFRYFGAGVGAEIPFNTFDRLEFGLTWLNTSTENVDDPEISTISKMHLVPNLKFVHDDIMWGFNGPARGSRYFLQAEGSPKFTNSNLGFLTVQGDFRHYVDVGSGFVLALRGAAGASFGPDPQAFFVGGTENWINRRFRSDQLPYETAEDLYFLTPGYPLRGFDINELNGSKMFITNAEFRLPVFLSVFFDMGSAWEDDFIATKRNENGTRIPNDLLMSTGIGMRLFLLGFPLKIDVAWKNNYHAFSKPVWLVSIGQDF